MSCNTKTSLAAVIDAVNAQLNNNYVDRDDPRINQGVFTEPTIRGGLMLDEAAKLDFCGFVQECGVEAPFGKLWIDRPLYPDTMLVSYDEAGDIKAKWENTEDVLAASDIGKSYMDLNSVSELASIAEPLDDARVYVKSYYPGLNTGGGFFTYKASNPSIYDGGVSFGKWRRIITTLTPQCFGAIGDRTKRFINSQFSTLELAQVHFPLVEDIAKDTIDWAGIQALFDYCKANYVGDVNLQGVYVNTREIDFAQGHGGKTKKFSGSIHIVPEGHMHHVIRIAGSFLKFDEIITGLGNPSWQIPYGVYIGGHTGSGATDNSSFGTIEASGFSQASLMVNQNALFCTFDNVQVGGGRKGTTQFSNVQPIAGTNDSKITLEYVPPYPGEKLTQTAGDYPDTNSYLSIEGKPYLIVGVDRAASTVNIRPKYTGVGVGTASYFYGCGFHHAGNNAGCISVNNMSARGGAIGLSSEALYAGVYNNISLEGNMLGISQSHLGDISMNLQITRAYFEGNTYDYIFSGVQYGGNTGIRIRNAMGINPAKMHNVTSKGAANGGYLPIYSTVDFGGKELTYNGYYYDYPAYLSKLYLDLHDAPSTVQFQAGSTNQQVEIIFNETIVNLVGSTETALVLRGNGTDDTTPTILKGTVTFTCPEGFTFNDTGLDTISFSGFYKTPIFHISVYLRSASDVRVVVISCDSLKADLQASIQSLAPPITTEKGTTAQRPTAPVLGQRYYDTTLLADGKPIEWNGTAWVDSTGVAV